jgi:hypothetical protein
MNRAHPASRFRGLVVIDDEAAGSHDHQNEWCVLKTALAEVLAEMRMSNLGNLEQAALTARRVSQRPSVD